MKADFINLKTKASKNGVPTEATLYVAKEYPAWKVAVLAKLRARHAKKELPLLDQEEFNKSDEAKAQWKAIMGELMSDKDLKPFAKHLGPFAAFKRDEATVLGAESALSASALFDEHKILTEMQHYLKDKLDCSIEVRMAEDPKAKEHAEAASQAQPGKPSVYFSGGSGAAPKAKAKAAGKAKAAPQSANSSSTSKVSPAAFVGVAVLATKAPITDMKAFNDYISTRGYFEAGGQPTAADRTQLAAMSKDPVDAQQYPHAARWQQHVSSFPDMERKYW